MPPKRSTRSAAAAAAAPAAPKPLEGCHIVLSGTFAITQGAVKTKVQDLGADVISSVSDRATHLISTPHDFLRNTIKVRDAVSKGVPIVGLDWLLECEKNGAIEPTQPYDLTAPAPAPSAPAPAPAGAASQSQSQVPPPKATRAKAKAGGKRAASAAASDDEEDVKPVTKKAKRGAKTAATNGTSNGAAAANGVRSGPADDADDDDADDTKQAPAPTTKGKGKGKAAAAKLADKKDTAPVDGQKAKSKTIHVPLDEACLMSGYVVYVDGDGHIWDASLNQTNASNNNNKFYRIQVIHNGAGDFKTWTRWGRVGDRGQTAILGNGTEDNAISQFKKKFKDKAGHNWEDRNEPAKPGKYTFIERSYNEDSGEEDANDGDDVAGKKDKWVPPLSKLSEPVQNLMKLIFNKQYFEAAMTELNYDVNKLPLGKLSKTTISRGFQALKDLSALFDDPSLAESRYDMTLAQATEHLSNSYYSLIPHAFGRNRPPVIHEQTLLKKEVELLESLSDMKDASLIMKLEQTVKDAETVHPLDKLYSGLGMQEMTAVDRDTVEFKALRDYLNDTRGQTHGHNYTVQDIFRIERDGEHARFEKESPLGVGAAPQDRRLLWHGSRVTNFGGILSQGLRIAPPEAPVSGYMFGKGIYLADMSSKSANYCCSYISGGTALLLLCEAELGDPIQELTTADYEAGEKAKKNGMFSTWGKGMTGPKKWRDAGEVLPGLDGVKMPDTSVKPGSTNAKNAYLQYNEYIVYDVAQVRLRYLLRVQM